MIIVFVDSAPFPSMTAEGMGGHVVVGVGVGVSVGEKVGVGVVSAIITELLTSETESERTAWDGVLSMYGAVPNVNRISAIV